MNQQNLTRTQVIESAMSSLGPGLTSGLAPAEAAWCRQAFSEVILPFRLPFDAGTPGAIVSGLRDTLVSDLDGRFSALEPRARWAAIVHEYYAVRLQALSGFAFALARARHAGARPDAEVEADAAGADTRLDTLLAEMREHAPVALDVLQEEVSEATLDLFYARYGGDLVSLRMSRATT
jgi:hypothetical protein